MKKLLAPISIALGFMGVVLAGFLVSAHASQAAAPDDGTLLDLARPIFDQIMKGDYIPAAAAALIFCVALLKRYAPGRYGEFVHSDVGGSLTTLAMSFGGALFTATVGDAPWTWAMLWTSSQVAFYAAGGYVLLKKLLVEPVLKPLAARAPSWAQPLFAMVMWIFDKKVSEGEVLVAAKNAGDAAVKANPGAGASTIVGDAKDL